MKEDREYGLRKRAEMFFEFREDNGKTIEDLGFSLSKFFFEGLKSSCNDFSVFGYGRRFKEFGVFKSKESKDEGIF